jgi:choloylglycine hydrolase
MKRISHKLIFATLFAILCTIYPTDTANACTRVIYEGDSSLVIIGRSLDWKVPIPTNIYVYPAGMKKVSSDQPNAISWTSKYGAVYAVGYDGGVEEGMNEKGLSVNSLFCKNSEYTNEQTSGRAPMSLSVFVAWLLDINATTAEVIETVKNQNFSITSATFDGGTQSKLHFGVTDATGNSAIIEFDGGDIKIYNPGEIKAMTNDPMWPDMKAIIKYWQSVGGVNMLPGTVRSADRCVRANFFVTHVDKTSEANLGAHIVRSVMMNASVPYLYTPQGEPNVSSTQWRSLSNLRDMRYYYDDALNNGFYYIDLKKCNLRPGASVLKLTTSEYRNICGEANKYLKKVEPFTPIW